MPSDFLHNFMDQKWEDLLLLHWPVAQVRVQETLPDDLRVDLFEEQAWLSVVGFRLSGLKIAPFRWIQWPGFWEINLRTYVKDKNGRKGIWFYSLDSSDLFAVIGARILYGLHYNYARTDGGVKDNQIFSIRNENILIIRQIRSSLQIYLQKNIREKLKKQGSIHFFWKDIVFGREENSADFQSLQMSGIFLTNRLW